MCNYTKNDTKRKRIQGKKMEASPVENTAAKRRKKKLTNYRKDASPLQRKKGFGAYMRANGALYAMAIPGVLCVLLFSYVPMYGVLIAFQKYSPAKGVFGSPWVGFEQFIKFFKSPYCERLFTNTFLLGLLTILFSFPAPIILALLLNEMRSVRLKRVTQTISYMPYFISTVVVIGLLKQLLTTNGGVVNSIREMMGFLPKDFFADPQWFRPLYILSGIWSSIGYGSILYLAAISGINPELYESAVLDGASRWQQIRHITLPCIMSTVVIQLIFAVGGIVGNDYQKILLMQSPLNYSTSDVFSTFVYREGILGGSYSYSTAVNLLTSVISVVFLLLANWFAKRAGEEALF